MKKLYNLIFIITLILIGGLITNVDAGASLTAANGGQITVTRNVAGVDNPVSNTFTYSLEADSNNPAEVTGLPSSMNIVFNRVAPTNLNEYGWGTATQTGTLDLTGVTFPKVGDYLFTLRETTSSNNSNYPVDGGNNYTIKVSVRYETDSNNVPTSSMTAVVANIKGSNNSKVDNVLFSNFFIGDIIFISKQVQGNMADTEEYFKILLNIDCLTGDTYIISYDDGSGNYNQPASISYNGSTINRMPNTEPNSIPSHWGTYTCGTDNYIYLKHGETAEINGLLYGQEYSFTEQGAALYKTYINDSQENNKSSGTLKVGSNKCYILPHSSEPGGGGVGKTNIIGNEVEPVNLGGATKDTSTKSLANETGCGKSVIVNEYDSIIDTGLVLKFLPYIIIVVIAGIGLTVFLVSKKKRNKLSVEE